MNKKLKYFYVMLLQTMSKFNSSSNKRSRSLDDGSSEQVDILTIEYQKIVDDLANDYTKIVNAYKKTVAEKNSIIIKQRLELNDLQNVIKNQNEKIQLLETFPDKLELIFI